MKLAILLSKYMFISLLVLLLSQISVKGRRICDHVYDVTHSSAIQKSLSFVSQHVDYNAAVKKGMSTLQTKSKAALSSEEQP